MHGDVKFCGYGDSYQSPEVSSHEHEALKARVRQLESALGIEQPSNTRLAYCSVDKIRGVIADYYLARLQDVTQK
jgi:hypothetical protein